MVKNLPAMQELQETWVQSLGREDPLEEGTATHSSIVASRIPWTEELGRLQSIPNPEIKPRSPAAPALQADSLLLSLLGRPRSGRVTQMVKNLPAMWETWV